MIMQEHALKGRATSGQTPRRSNIELLRIIAMVFIVAHHFAVHGGFSFQSSAITVNRLWIQFIQVGGKIGVDIFVLISGYFLVSAKSLKLGKVIKLWAQIFTYSVLIFAIFVLAGIVPFSIKELVKHILPISLYQWWFASLYFMLYLLSPFINVFLRSLSKKGYQKLIVLLTVCWSIIPTEGSLGFNKLLWFIFLYACAGYIRLHSKRTNTKGAVYILLSFLCALLTFSSAVVFDLLGTKISFFANNATFFYELNRLPILAASLLMFIGFLKINIGHIKIINIVSSATFGVYLIHDNGYINPFLWKVLFKNASYQNSRILIPYSLMVVALVFILCTIAELIRIYLLEKPCTGIINKIAEKIQKAKDKFFSLKIFEKI